MKYFSQSTSGFYDDAIHGQGMPADVVAVSDEHYAALMAGQAQGRRIVSGLGGQPMLADALPATAEQMWEAIKSERDRRTQQGGYAVSGHWFHSDTFSRTQQMGLVMLGSALPPGVEWKTMTGEFVLMTQQLAQQVFAAAAASDIAVFAAAEAHRAAMLASADPGLYDYAGGWPPAFGE